ncbi:MAG: hypothetical protein KTR29_03810 [Rhodothermaceae bacterium]|nr:hypothetical protein [Rhodothermaceae bacterium]
MSTKGWLLSIGAGQHQQSVLIEARALGYQTLAVDINPDAFARSLADAFICHSAWDAKGILARLPESIRPHIKGVVTQAARGCTVTTAQLGKWLGVPHLNPSVADFFLDKQRALKRFNTTRTYTFASIDKIPESMGVPFVIKQLSTSGGLGNYLVHSRQDLEHFRHLKGEFVVEPFIVGRHFGLVGISDGVHVKFYGAVERRLRTNMTLDHAFFPADLDDAQAKVIRFANRVLQESGFNLGPFQLEFILQSDSQCHFIELEPSVLGSYISEWMIPTAGAGNMIEDSIRVATGEPIDFNSSTPQGIAFSKYYYPEDPYISQQQGRHKAFKQYGDGDLIDIDSRQYVGNALIYADTLQQAEYTLTQLESSTDTSNSVANHEYRGRNIAWDPAG